MHLNWLLDAYLLERSVPVSGPSFEEALRASGCRVTVTSLDGSRRALGDDIPRIEGPTVCYGSFPFVRAAGKDARIVTPVTYCRLEALSFSAFSAHLGDLLLSDDFVLLPFAELSRRPPPGRPVFVKPDRVTKSFTGFSISPEDFAFEIGCLRTAQNVAPDELVVMASAREIVSECRFVVAQGRVAAASTYGWSDGFVPSPDIDPRCRAVAEDVASRAWQADSVYTCDVAMAVVDGVETARVVELNSFSCAGLYACDTVSVAQAVNAAAMDDLGLS